MTVVVGSIRGAPGVTTVSLLLASCLPGGVVAEADLDGGVLAPRYRLGREPGLTTMAAAGSQGPEGWRRHAQRAGGVPVLVGPDVPERAAALWARAGDQLATTLARSAASVVVDVGRLRPAGLGGLLTSASLVVVLVRPVTEDLVGLAHRLSLLRNGVATATTVAVVGSGPYSPEQIADDHGVDVLGVLPEDHHAAAMLTRGGTAQALGRTELARATRSLAEEIVGRLRVPAQAPRALTMGRRRP